MEHSEMTVESVARHYGGVLPPFRLLFSPICFTQKICTHPPVGLTLTTLVSIPDLCYTNSVLMYTSHSPVNNDEKTCLFPS